MAVAGGAGHSESGAYSNHHSPSGRVGQWRGSGEREGWCTLRAKPVAFGRGRPTLHLFVGVGEIWLICRILFEDFEDILKYE